ncbi:MAG: ammonium transporter [Alphaproteobacteria bacterium]|nr:ammonium transporter [Alphaproteobacteria bacterium]
MARGGLAALTAATTLLSAGAAWAQEAAPVAAAAAPTLDKGDTAWMLVSTLLVLLMLIPGLALFYGGLVRKENVITTVAQSFMTCCVASVLWVMFGYSLAFTEGSAFIGGLDRVFLKGLELGSLSGTIPESVFIMFQLTFAAITTALILGAVADRAKFSGILVFAAIWFVLVYCPVAHWVWGPKGFLGGTGMTDYAGFLGLGPILDFAGGTVVHVNAGVAGLVCAIVLGRRQGFGQQSFPPHNLVLSLIGASLLWVGWFGFNAGSAVASGDRAGMAMLVTHVATATAALSWMFVDWAANGKPSVLGLISGAVAGLVAITPASGFVGVTGAFAIGISAGVFCFWAAKIIKDQFKVDDSLDVFSVHGVGGIVGSILTGVFAEKAIGGASGLLEGNITQLWAQIAGTAVVVVYTAVVTFIILKVVQLTVGMRVDDKIEKSSLDLHLHGETVL